MTEIKTEVQSSSPAERGPIAMQLQDVAVSFHGRVAVRDCTFDVAKNRVTSLIGPSGSGKTTLLRALNRLHDLTPGAKVSGKITCIGLNYRAHAAESQSAPPRVPILFNKYDNALAAHNCTIKLPPRDVSFKFDYETELLIVIGKQARNVAAADALKYVAGYCTAQDFSARDLQSELPGGQWMVGKTLDSFGPIGPYFVSADVVGDASNLKIETYVNGEVRQSSNTGDMIFGPQQLVAYISTLWTLEPGDIIFSGTPSGVIGGMPKEKQVWLKAGDQIRSSIEKLGDLKFTLA